jgi:hypothetical protein
MDREAGGMEAAVAVLAMRRFLGADSRIGLAPLFAFLCCLGSALAPASAPLAEGQARVGDRPSPSSKPGQPAAPPARVKAAPPPGTIEAPLLTMTGVGLDPVTIETDALTMTGVGLDPVTIETGALTMTGVGLDPVTIETGALTMTGLGGAAR